MTWDDLRFALAVAETGSSARAGRKLGVAHTTVVRRIGALEKQAGARLFDRVGTKLVPTAAGQAIVDLAREFAERISKVEATIRDDDRRLSGLVTVTIPELLASYVVTRIRLFRDRYPGIRLRLRVDVAALDLARREADIAIRVNPAPDSDLVGQKIATIDLGVYGSPETAADAEASWVCFDGDVAANPQARWEEANIPPDRVALRTNSRTTFVDAVRAGVGVGLLPCAYADADPTLVRRGAPIPGLRADVWVLTHRSVRKLPRIAAAMKFLSDSLRAGRVSAHSRA